jgi:hypothetical protein
MQHEVSFETGHGKPLQPVDEKDISPLLINLTFLSTFTFIFSALLIRFLINLQTALFLKHFSIHFEYRLFDIRFLTADSSKWPLNRIMIVFGLGYLLFSVAGIILLAVMKKSHKQNWKTRLFSTWIAFLMVNTFLAAIIAGVLFYKGFGIAFQWTVGNIIIRSMIGLSVLGLMIFSRPIWVFLFYKASPRRIFFKNEEYKNFYIQNVFFKSWLFGFIILLFFNWPLFDGFWPVFIFSLGFIAMPLYKKKVSVKKISLKKSENEISGSRNKILIMIIILVLIRIAGSFSFEF